MSSQDFARFGLQIALMLITAMVFGQIMLKFKQPAVLGEMIGGVIIGPTLLGALFPQFFGWLFHSSDSVTIVRDASIKLGMLFFLFIAGLEVDLSELRRLGKRAILIGLVGTLLPIAAGVGLVYAIPREFWGTGVQEHFLAFALFVGMNLANSANPVIARILMDLGLLKGEIGTLIMTATIVDDLVNWSLFAIIMSDIAPVSGSLASSQSISLPVTLLLVVLLFVVILGFGRLLGPAALHWARRNLPWPNGFIALTAFLILICGSVSEWLGIHAFLGAFLAGAALGGSEQEKNEAHVAMNHFVLSFFAPIYFVSMGMTTNFVANFDFNLVVIIFIAACVSKIGAVLLGARMAGMDLSRKTWAIGFGLNARGATGIILAGVGLSNHLIDERIFVAIVTMAVATSLLSAPVMNRLLNRQADQVIAGDTLPN